MANLDNEGNYLPHVNGNRARGAEISAPPSSPKDVMLNRDELLWLLNRLLEGERAGANATILCREPARDAVTDSVLFDIGRDEGRFCAMLTRHIVRLGGTPSRAVGEFYDRLRALQGQSERLAFLNRGQQWVIRKLDEALPAIHDASLERDLKEMRETHARNVGRCKALVTRCQTE